MRILVYQAQIPLLCDTQFDLSHDTADKYMTLFYALSHTKDHQILLMADELYCQCSN